MRLKIVSYAVEIYLITMFAALLLLSLASAQTTTIQPIHVWMSQPEYYPGQIVTVFWDKSGPCVIPGATGTLTLEGAGYTDVNDVNVLSGQWNGPSDYISQFDVGAYWAVRLVIHAPNGCVSEGSTSVRIIAPPVQQPSPGGLSLIDYGLIGVSLIIIIIAVAAFRQRKKSSSQSPNKT